MRSCPGQTPGHMLPRSCAVRIKISILQVIDHLHIKQAALFILPFFDHMDTGGKIIFPDLPVDLFGVGTLVDMPHNGRCHIVIFCDQRIAVFQRSQISVPVIAKQRELITVVRFSLRRADCRRDIAELAVKSLLNEFHLGGLHIRLRKGFLPALPDRLCQRLRGIAFVMQYGRIKRPNLNIP